MIIRLLVLALGIPAAASAVPQTPQNPLAAVRSAKCSFPVYATATWTNPRPDLVTATQDFTFQIDTIDAKKRTARFVGSGGSAVPVSLVLSPISLTVIEQTTLGNINMTTLFAAGRQETRVLAVHSRHIGDPTALPTVSQNYGSCEVQ